MKKKNSNGSPVFYETLTMLVISRVFADMDLGSEELNSYIGIRFSHKSEEFVDNFQKLALESYEEAIKEIAAIDEAIEKDANLEKKKGS